MKLRIVQQIQENRGTEEESQMRDETSPPSDPSPVSNPAILSGKRKRKPKELIDDFTPLFRRKKKPVPKSKDENLEAGGTSLSKLDATVDESATPVQQKTPTMVRAEEIYASLGDEYPSFMKTCVRSHVGSCFWMGLPVPFCKLHLPEVDTMAVLENEEGKKFPIKYIAQKTGLSAGWRKFVAGNKLLEGDILIFQLVGECIFKVYIVRENDISEVDGALSLLILDSKTKHSDADGGGQTKKKRRPKSLPITVVQKKKQTEGPITPQPRPIDEHSGNDSDGVASEVLEGFRHTTSSFHMKDVNRFEEFQIMVNGACIDSELPEQIRRKYYNLCCSKNTFLHENILPGLYSKLAAGIIFETVTTADAIQTCTLTTPQAEFEVWEKSLKSFELLGLNVGFLRARLRRLRNLVFESDGALEARRYQEAMMERDEAEGEIDRLEAKLVELKALREKYDGEIEKLKADSESYEHNFKKEVNAPW